MHLESIIKEIWTTYNLTDGKRQKKSNFAIKPKNKTV